MPNPHRRLLFISALILPTMGCTVGQWRPSKPAPLPTASQPAQVKFSEYLQANRFGRWTYERKEVQPSDHPAGNYTRRVTLERMQEGVLEERNFLPLARYLQGSPISYPLGRSHWGIFFDLGEPIDPLPPELEGNKPISSSTSIRYFDQNGRLIDTGTLTREAQIEGIETVECPAGTFENCLRIRVDLLIHFRWGPHVDWKGYLWLSPKVGEVRRVQSMSGWYLIFWFGSAHEYQLASYEPIETASKPAVPPTAWTRGAMVLDRVIPYPQIAGMVVDFADASTVAMTKPAE